MDLVDLGYFDGTGAIVTETIFKLTVMSSGDGGMLLEAGNGGCDASPDECYNLQIKRKDDLSEIGYFTPNVGNAPAYIKYYSSMFQPESYFETGDLNEDGSKIVTSCINHSTMNPQRSGMIILYYHSSTEPIITNEGDISYYRGYWDNYTVLYPTTPTLNDCYGRAVAKNRVGSGWGIIAVSAYSGVYILEAIGDGLPVQRDVIPVPDQTIDWGASLALNGDGTILFVGAQDYTGTYTEQGCVYVYTYSNSVWTQTGSIITAPDAGLNHNFGCSVSCSADGSTLVVGATGRNGGKGAVYIYTLNGGVYTYSRILTSVDRGYLYRPDHLYYQWSDGMEVSITNDGKYIWFSSLSKFYVGYWDYNHNASCYYFGKVSITKDIKYFLHPYMGNSYCTSPGAYVQNESVQTPMYDVYAPYLGSFGSAIYIYIDAMRVVEGGKSLYTRQFFNIYGVNSYQVQRCYYFPWSEELGGWDKSKWKVVVDGVSWHYTALNAFDINEAGDCLVYSQSIDATAGCYKKIKVNGVFVPTGSRFVPPDFTTQDHFGYAIAMNQEGVGFSTVAISSTTVVVDNVTNAGRVYIFDATGTPFVKAIITSPDNKSGGLFGSHLAMNGDGTKLVIADKYPRVAIDYEEGTNLYNVHFSTIYIFELIENVWTLTDRITDYDYTPEYVYTYANDTIRISSIYLSIDGNTLIIGDSSYVDEYEIPSSPNPTPGSACGAVTIYKYQNSVWEKQRDILPTRFLTGNDYFPLIGGQTGCSSDLTRITTTDTTYSVKDIYLKWICPETNVWTDSVTIVDDLIYVPIDFITESVPNQSVPTIQDFLLDLECLPEVDTHPIIKETKIYLVNKYNANQLEGVYDPTTEPLLPYDSQVDDRFGISLCSNFDNTMLFIGAPGCDGGRGAVYVYDIVDGDKVFHSKIFASDGSANALFGSSVAVDRDGNYLVVGAPNVNKIYRFQLVGGVVYNELNIFTGDVIAGDNFGSSLWLSQNGLYSVVGASGKDGIRDGQGACKMYKWDNYTWNSMGSWIRSSDASIDMGFGSSLQVNKTMDTLVVGSPRAKGTYLSQGCVHVFRYINGEWIQTFYITPALSFPDLLFGSSIGINSRGTIIGVGASGYTLSKSNQGGVYIFDFNGIRWNQRGEVIVCDTPEVNAHFGSSIVFDSTGTKMSIGAYGV